MANWPSMFLWHLIIQIMFKLFNHLLEYLILPSTMARGNRHGNGPLLQSTVIENYCNSWVG